jgi:TRAP-type C4-dicarboxylate transport system permease small subunit
MKILRKLDDHLEGTIMGTLLIGISFVILLQIVMRLLKMSLSWPEEIARYFYVWSVFLSLAYTIRTKTNLRVDIVVNFFPAGARRIIETFLHLLNAVFFATLFYYSISVVISVKMSRQTSPALEIPMYAVYAIVPVGFLLAAVRALQQFYFGVKGARAK